MKIEGELAVHTLCCRIIFNKIFKMNFRRGNVKYWKNLNSIFEYTHAPKKENNGHRSINITCISNNVPFVLFLRAYIITFDDEINNKWFNSAIIFEYLRIRLISITIIFI